MSVCFDAQRKVGWLMAWVVAVGVIFAEGNSLHGQILFEDFDDGDGGWTHLDLLAITGAGAADFDADGGVLGISSVDVVPPLDFCNGAGAFWTESFTDPRYSDGIVTATFRLDNDISNAMVAVRMDGDGNGYNFAANNGMDRIFIDRLTSFRGLEDGLASIEFPLAEGVGYVIEGTAVGPNLSMKIWQAGGPVPSEPILTAVDSTYDQGALLIAAYYCPDSSGQQLSAQFDNISFAVPEPTTAAQVLIALACLALVGAARRRTGWFMGLAIGTAVACLGDNSLAETVFFDDFRDRDSTNDFPLDRDGNPVVWTPLAGVDDGTFDASSGDYILSTDQDPGLVAYNASNVLGNTSIRTRLRQEGAPAAIAVLARADTAALTAYQGGVSAITGNAYIVRNESPDGQPLVLDRTPAGLDFTTSDALLQFDVMGDNLSLFVWPAGAPKPAQPILSLTDNMLTGGLAGLLLDPDGTGPSSGIFRFVHVADTSIPEPSTAVLSCLGMLAILGCRLHTPSFNPTPTATGEFR